MRCRVCRRRRLDIEAGRFVKLRGQVCIASRGKVKKLWMEASAGDGADDERVSLHRFGVKATVLPVALANKDRPQNGRGEKRMPGVWFYDIPSDGMLFLQEGIK